MISYEPFWKTMKEKKMTAYALVAKHKVSNSTLTRMRRNDPMSTNTLNDLCNILDCDVQDVIKHTRDETNLNP